MDKGGYLPNGQKPKKKEICGFRKLKAKQQSQEKA